MIAFSWCISVIGRTHDKDSQASCATSATIWISHKFGTTQSVRYLPSSSGFCHKNTILYQLDTSTRSFDPCGCCRGSILGRISLFNFFDLVNQGFRNRSFLHEFHWKRKSIFFCVIYRAPLVKTLKLPGSFSEHPDF